MTQNKARLASNLVRHLPYTEGFKGSNPLPSTKFNKRKNMCIQIWQGLFLVVAAMFTFLSFKK